MDPAPSLSLSEPHGYTLAAKLLGPDKDEVNRFYSEAEKVLSNPGTVEEFTERVEHVAKWANDVDASFSRVTKTFERFANDYGSQLPEVKEYYLKWKGYNKAGLCRSLGGPAYRLLWDILAMGGRSSSLSGHCVPGRSSSHSWVATISAVTLS